MNSIGFSQDLVPILQRGTQGDTLFCFSKHQARLLARTIEKNALCDSTLSVQRDIIDLLETGPAIMDSINASLQGKIDNMALVDQNRQKEIDLLENTILLQKKDIRRQRARATLLWIGLGMVTAFHIVR